MFDVDEFLKSEGQKIQAQKMKDGSRLEKILSAF